MMPGAGWWLAIDFGTSFTTTAMAVDGHVEILEIDSSRYVPSVVFLDEDGTLLVGRDADSEAATNPARAERVPKRALVAAEQVRLGNRSVATVDLVAAVLARVSGEAIRRHSGRRPGRVVLTHPARWQPGGLELRRLTEAADRAGLGEPDLVAEPVAAAHHYAQETGDVAVGGAIGVYDFGGGTFDTAVLRRRRDGFQLAGSPGGDVAMGGEDLDAVLLEILGEHAEAVDADRWYAVWDEPGRAAERARTLLRRDVTRAKESLSTRPAANLFVPGFEDEFRVTRREYEKAIDPILRRSVGELESTVARAGLTPADLAEVYLTGGSSRTPRITALLAELTTHPPTTRGDPKAAVVLGALATIPGSVSATLHVRVPPELRRPVPSPPTAVVPATPPLTPTRLPAQRDAGPAPEPAGITAPAPTGAGPSTAELAAEITALAEEARVADLVAAVSPTVVAGRTDDVGPALRKALDGLATAIGTRHTPFAGLPADIALQVLREGRGELGDLGRCLTRLDDLAERVAAVA